MGADRHFWLYFRIPIELCLVASAGMSIKKSVRHDSHRKLPLQVIRKAPLRVSLFGNSPASKMSETGVELEIDNPTHLNIRSLAISASTMRFNEHNYGGSSIPARSGLFSPRKRQKTVDHDLDSRWKEAVKLMLRKDTQDNDGFPRFISMMDVDMDLDEFLDTDDVQDYEPCTDEGPWVPPRANFEYDIPGELVLARDRVNATQYWPAKILEYIPPKHRKQKARYKVLFFDHTIKDITEDMFFTDTQDGFATCKVGNSVLPPPSANRHCIFKLGESEGNYGLDEEERDADDVLRSEPIDEDEDTLRASTPPPSIPPPKFFETLDIEEQFEYVKPILVAILQDKYAPVRPRHDAFMGSVASRQHVVDTNQLSGDLRGYELENLGPLIRRWVRRRQRRQELGYIPADSPPADGGDDAVEVVRRVVCRSDFI